MKKLILIIMLVTTAIAKPPITVGQNTSIDIVGNSYYWGTKNVGRIGSWIKYNNVYSFKVTKGIITDVRKLIYNGSDIYSAIRLCWDYKLVTTYTAYSSVYGSSSSSGRYFYRVYKDDKHNKVIVCWWLAKPHLGYRAVVYKYFN